MGNQLQQIYEYCSPRLLAANIVYQIPHRDSQFVQRFQLSKSIQMLFQS